MHQIELAVVATLVVHRVRVRPRPDGSNSERTRCRPVRCVSRRPPRWSHPIATRADAQQPLQNARCERKADDRALITG